MNRFDRDRFDQMGKEALSRVEELMNSSRINELLHKREEDEKKKNCILWVLAIIGAVAAVAGIAYAVYRFFTPLRVRSRRRRRKRLNNRECYNSVIRYTEG